MGPGTHGLQGNASGNEPFHPRTGRTPVDAGGGTDHLLTQALTPQRRKTTGRIRACAYLGLPPRGGEDTAPLRFTGSTVRRNADICECIAGAGGLRALLPSSVLHSVILQPSTGFEGQLFLPCVVNNPLPANTPHCQSRLLLQPPARRVLTCTPYCQTINRRPRLPGHSASLQVSHRVRPRHAAMSGWCSWAEHAHLLMPLFSVSPPRFRRLRIQSYTSSSTCVPARPRRRQR